MPSIKEAWSSRTPPSFHCGGLILKNSSTETSWRLVSQEYSTSAHKVAHFSATSNNALFDFQKIKKINKYPWTSFKGLYKWIRAHFFCTFIHGLGLRPNSLLDQAIDFGVQTIILVFFFHFALYVVVLYS